VVEKVPTVVPTGRLSEMEEEERVRLVGAD